MKKNNVCRVCDPNNHRRILQSGGGLSILGMISK